MPPRELLLVQEMIDAAEQAMRLAEGMTPETLAAERVRRDALLWNFAVLGEAATQLSSDFKAAHAGVNWSRPALLRNRIIHGYWSIDLGILLVTAQDDLPSYVRQLCETLEEFAHRDFGARRVPASDPSPSQSRPTRELGFLKGRSRGVF